MTSDADDLPRLSKRMGELGLCSHREAEAEAWIVAGWVKVDGQIVDVLGTRLDPSLAQWIDRNVSDSATDATALCGSAMPRCVTSRRVDRGTGGLQLALKSKNDVKHDVVLRAIECIEDRVKKAKADR